MNATRIHLFTHVRQSMQGQSGMKDNEYADGMVEHDGDVGKLLKALDDLGIANNTIVVYTTDNGRTNGRGRMQRQRRSAVKKTPIGKVRSACLRWSAGPATSKRAKFPTKSFLGFNRFPTLVAAAGDADVKDRLLKGTNLGSKSFKVHLDGYNQLPYLTGQQPKSARSTFFYFNDDGEVVAYRYDDWKLVFCEQRQPGGFTVWANPFTCLRAPKVFNLRMDPYRARRRRVGSVLRLARQERLSHSVRCVASGSLPTDLQGIPAQSALCEL